MDDVCDCAWLYSNKTILKERAEGWVWPACSLPILNLFRYRSQKARSHPGHGTLSVPQHPIKICGFSLGVSPVHLPSSSSIPTPSPRHQHLSPSLTHSLLRGKSHLWKTRHLSPLLRTLGFPLLCPSPLQPYCTSFSSLVSHLSAHGPLLSFHDY